MEKSSFIIYFFFFIIFIFTNACEQKASEELEPMPKEFVLQTPAHFGNLYQIPEDNQPTVEGIELGRMLFYDKRLSKDSTISCASCHQQKLAFTDGKAFSTGFQNRKTPRGAMSLVNLIWVDKFFWDGRANSLEEQALQPIQDVNEMNLSLGEAVFRLQNTALYPPLFKAAFGSEIITEENIAKALSQFQRTLISSNSKYDKIVRGEIQATEQEARAIELFFTHPIPEANLRGGNCGDCHGSNLITLNTFHNNGLDLIYEDKGLGAITGRKEDFGKMRAPSLRNIALTAPYMHDGRFQTLEEVLDHYNEYIQAHQNLDPLIIEASNEVGGNSLMLTEQEKEDIILFLHLLTDEDFINDKRFSNPFIQELQN